MEVDPSKSQRRAVVVLPLGFGGWWERPKERDIQLHGSGCSLIIIVFRGAKFVIQWGTR